MGRLLRNFMIMAVMAAAVAWLADHPSRLELDWQGYRIESSLAMLLLAGLALFGLLRLPFWVHSRWFGARRQYARQRKGIDALTRGMTALAAGEANAARRHAAQADRLLEGLPFTLLMQAQAAQLDGDEMAARNYFQSMLAAPDTEFLGLRGLLAQAMRQGDTGYAARLVERGLRLQPKSPWLIRNKFELECATGEWPQARETLGRAVQAKLISKAERNRRQGILAFAEASQAQNQGAPEQALALARQAIKGAPGLVPANVLAAQLLAQSGRPDKAARLLEKAWGNAPHPELAASYKALAATETPAQRAVRLRRLIAANPDHPESRFLEAETALAAGETARARELLQPLTDSQANGGASQRVCLLMARLAQAQGAGAQEVQHWLSRAPLAMQDPGWSCAACGKASPAWQMLCPACGEFDSIQWQAGGRAFQLEPGLTPGLLAHVAPL